MAFAVDGQGRYANLVVLRGGFARSAFSLAFVTASSGKKEGVSSHRAEDVDVVVTILHLSFAQVVVSLLD